MPEGKEVGRVAWLDLTVEDADSMRDFYKEVVGWKVEPVSMGDYSDYVMADPASRGQAGVCHARGVNEGIPPVWLAYIYVADLDTSIKTCRRLGGKVVHGPSEMGDEGRYCVIEDPTGAALALFEAS